MSGDNDAGMDALADQLAVMRSPFDHHYHPETGKLAALFPKVKNHAQGSPEQFAAEESWSARAVSMHAAQTTVLPKAKPNVNALAEHKERMALERGD